MPFYRKKPVVIEAFQWTPEAIASSDMWPQFIREAVERDRHEDRAFYPTAEGKWVVNTMEGPHIVTLGNFMIRGVQGELYSCDPVIFGETYERA